MTSTFASSTAIPLPRLPVGLRAWRKALLSMRGEGWSIRHCAPAARGEAGRTGASADRRAVRAADSANSSTRLAPRGAIEVDVAPACVSIKAANELAQRAGVAAHDLCWIAPMGARIAGASACTGLGVYTPRTTRESIWAIEQALLAADVPAVAAWLPRFPSERRQSELRLLRRLRALALRQGKTVVLLRYPPAATPNEREGEFAANATGAGAAAD